MVTVDPLSVALTKVGGSGSFIVVADTESEYEESVADGDALVT